MKATLTILKLEDDPIMIFFCLCTHLRNLCSCADYPPNAQYLAMRINLSHVLRCPNIVSTIMEVHDSIRVPKSILYRYLRSSPYAIIHDFSHSPGKWEL